MEVESENYLFFFCQLIIRLASSLYFKWFFANIKYNVGKKFNTLLTTFIVKKKLNNVVADIIFTEIQKTTN